MPDASALSSAFITPTQDFETSLSLTTATATQWDSCVRFAVHEHCGSNGIFTEILNDSSGVAYTLGWKTPSAIKRDSAYPLIIYLHGGTGTTLSTKGEKAWDMLNPLSDTFSLFLASPSSNRFTPWWSPQGIGRILQTLRYMTLHYPINPNKVFLAGVSDGATGCYAAANTVYSPFAGFMAISGFGGMLEQVSMSLVPANLMQRPIYNVNAGRDRIYNITMVMGFLNWLKQNSVMVQHKEYPEEEHGFDYRPREFGTLAGYIRTWTKPVDRTAIRYTVVPGFPVWADNIVECVRDKSGQTPRVTGDWDKDTLRITAEGIKEITVSVPGMDKKEIFVSRNNAKPKKVTALPSSPLLAYKRMVHTCFPVVKSAQCYEITF